MRLGDMLSRKGEVLGTQNPHLEGNANVALKERRLTTVDPAKITEKILTMDMGKEDLLTQWSAINFVGPDIVSVNVENREAGRYLMTEQAFEQMSTRLGIPSAYLKKCPVSGRAGRQEQLEYWREQIDDREILLRTRQFPEAKTDHGGQVRAVLGKTYEPIDNHRIWAWTQRVLESNPNMAMHYANIGDNTTHFRMLYQDPINIGTEQTPDYHYYGLHISDSETGARALTVDFLLYRLACLNGMISQVEGDHLLHTKHIHVDLPTLSREFFATIEKANEYRDTLLTLLEGAKATTITDPHSVIRRLGRHYRATRELAEKIIEAYEQEPNPTRFGIAQAFTRAARQLPMDRRTDLEQWAGQYLLEA